MTLLAASNLAKDYKLGDGLSRRRIRALDDVSITVRHGEVLGIVGTNGAGKSTLGLCLAGLIEPDDGKVSFDGEDISTLDRPATRALRRRLQLVQQDPFESLSPHFNVSEQLLEPLQIQGIEASPDRLNTALRQMRLPTTAEFLGRRMHELSGGQLQRLSIARALVLDPELLILDEPVSMLDPSEQAEVLSLLKAAQVARGMSMIVVGHDIAVIMRLADRIAVLHGGRIVDEEPGEQLISRATSSATHRLLAAAGVTQFAQTPVTGEEKTTL